MTAVSVLMPVYNAEATVDEALRSVLAQTGCDFDVVLIDDGSTDATVSIARALHDVRVRVLTVEHGGVVHAANAGLAAITRPLVARFDGDDVMLPGRLQRQVEHLSAHPAVALVGTHVRHDALDGLASDGMARYCDWLRSLHGAGDVERNLFVELPICHPTSMFRADLVRTLGGYRDLGWPEDYDLLFRLAQTGARLDVVPEVLHGWRDSATRLTRTHPRYSADAFLRLKAHFLARRFGARLRVWNAGRDGRRLARALADEDVEIVAFIDVDRRKIGGVRRGDVPIVGAHDVVNDGVPIVACVGIAAARAEIRAFLDARGFVELVDYVCAA